MKSQAYQVALDTAKAAEFTSGFEHCIDMLLELGRLHPEFNADGRVNSLKDLDGSDRQLSSVVASFEELSAEEFWHLVSSEPTPDGPVLRYPGWVPRTLRSIDVTPEGSEVDYFVRNQEFHAFSGEVA